MFKLPTEWPGQRHLFRDKAARSVIATWVVLALSVAAAVLLVT
jgi:hypothetical protein